MARRKTGDKKVEGKKNRTANGEVSKVQADDHSIAFEELHVAGNVGGDIRIGHTIGYTADQVSVLLKQITTTLQPKPFDGRCPYKGLEVFEEEDAELFFGRERLVNELVGRVKESRTVFITGPSGSGKSSLVRAGLIHALKQGAIKGSDRWLYETMKPGREPIKDLALAFSRLKSPELADYFRAHTGETDILNKCAESILSGRKDQRFVLFIDQFEEVFTQISGEEERVAFINMLAYAGTVENGRVIVLFAMRSDFVSNCATYPALNEMLSQEFRQIGAMQPEELVSAIALPARHVSLPIEDELIARIINDMKGEPGALPLMQFALKDLFDSQQEKGGVIALTLKDYLQHGGIHKSLERHADNTFSKLSESEQGLARSIFTGLIEIGRGTQDTKRTALFDELIPANTKPEDIGVIVQKLADARLIITDEQAGKDTVTISHEKLIEAWPWLKKLVNENRDVIALQNEIAADAKEWEDHKRDPSYLYTGARLANVHEQLETKKLVLSETSHEFVKVGQIREQRSQRTLIAGVSAVIVLLLVAVIVFSNLSITNANTASTAQAAGTDAVAQKGTAQAANTIAVAQAEAAQKQLEIAQAGELAAKSAVLRDRQPIVSYLLGVEAFRMLDSVGTRASLLDNLNYRTQLTEYLSGHTSQVTNIAFSPNGKILASGSTNRTIILWDVATGKSIGLLKDYKDIGSFGIDSLAFSPDGKTLASSNGMSIILWDLATRRPRGQPLERVDSLLSKLAFSPDGKILASSNDIDETIILWDVTTRQPIGQPLQGDTGSIKSIVFSPDGKTLASGGDNIILWNVSTHQPRGKPLTQYVAAVTSVAFSPDGKMLATGSYYNTITLWDVTTHQPVRQPLIGHTDWVNSVAFSPDGKTLASGSKDGSIILWDVVSGRQIGRPLKGHTSPVNCIAFSSDGKTLASSSEDYDAVILWDVSTHQSIGQPLKGHDIGVTGVAFSPNGKILASGSNDNTIILWSMATGRPTSQPLEKTVNQPFDAGVNSVVFSPDGTKLASGNRDGTVILWDLTTHQPIGQPLIVVPADQRLGRMEGVASIAFSPDGKTLAAGSEDWAVTLWDVATGKRIGQPLFGPSFGVKSVAFSPDGKTLASGSASFDDIILWDLASGKPIGQPLKGGTSFGINSVAFSADGKMLASSGGDMIILWDVITGKPIGQPLTGHTGSVYSIAFSPDGKTLASGSHDETIILWDVSTRQPIGQPIIGHTGYVYSVAFSPDGKTLASGSEDTTIMMWHMEPQAWIEESCQRAGRNFTLAEWIQYFPEKEYRKTCQEWPKDSGYYKLIVDEILSNLSNLDEAQLEFENVISQMKQDGVATWEFYMSNWISTQLDSDIKQEKYNDAIKLSQLSIKVGIPLLDIDLNELCWFGSLSGHAQKVLSYCEMAVELSPYVAEIRDSRGLARALTNDYTGAIEDFQFFVENSDPDHAELISQRQQWIIDLTAGQNPFTAEVLEELKNQ